MFALGGGKFGENRDQIGAALPLHLFGELGVFGRGLMFHRICEREQFVERMQGTCGFGPQERRSQQRHDRFPSLFAAAQSSRSFNITT
jgi:hypothetical protein